MQVFALAAGASAEAHPDRAVKALADHVAPQIGELAGVFGELESAAVDGGGHGCQRVEGVGDLSPVHIQ